MGEITDALKLQMELNQFRQEHDLPPLDIKKRECLKCGQTFLSMHRFNRLCDLCYEENCELGPVLGAGNSGLPQDMVSDDVDLEQFVSEHCHGEVHDYRKYFEMIHEGLKKKPKSLFDEIEENPVTSNGDNGGVGLIIRRIVDLPGPCDIVDIPPGRLGIRQAMNRRHLQCFRVSAQMNNEQIIELNESLSQGKSWVLFSPDLDVDVGVFSQRIVVR